MQPEPIGDCSKKSKNSGRDYAPMNFLLYLLFFAGLRLNIFVVLVFLNLE